jgi:hypothetical protein
MAFFTGIYRNAFPILNTPNTIIRVIDRSGKQYQPGETTIPSDKFIVLFLNKAQWVVYLQDK